MTPAQPPAKAWSLGSSRTGAGAEAPEPRLSLVPASPLHIHHVQSTLGALRGRCHQGGVRRGHLGPKARTDEGSAALGSGQGAVSTPGTTHPAPAPRGRGPPAGKAHSILWVQRVREGCSRRGKEHPDSSRAQQRQRREGAAAPRPRRGERQHRSEASSWREAQGQGLRALRGRVFLAPWGAAVGGASPSPGFSSSGERLSSRLLPTLLLLSALSGTSACSSLLPNYTLREWNAPARCLSPTAKKDDLKSPAQSAQGSEQSWKLLGALPGRAASASAPLTGLRSSQGEAAPAPRSPGWRGQEEPPQTTHKPVPTSSQCSQPRGVRGSFATGGATGSSLGRGP